LDGGNVISTKQLRDNSFVPADAKVVLAMSPNELAKSSATAGVMPMIDQEISGKFGLKFSELADLEWIQLEPGKIASQSIDRVIFRAVNPHDWKETLSKVSPPMKAVEFKGQTYFLASDAARPDSVLKGLGPAFYIADDRTLVAGGEEQIRKILGGDEKRMEPEAFPEFLGSAFALRIDMSFVKQASGVEKMRLEDNPMMALILPLLERAKVARLGIGPEGSDAASKDSVGLRMAFECDSPEGAEQVAKTLDASRTFALNVIRAKEKAMRELAPSSAPPEVTKLAETVFPSLTKSLADAKITTEKDWAVGETKIDIGAPTVAALVMPAMAKSKEAGMRHASMMNMKMLALAMHNYASVSQGRFPAAATVGADGKTKHSWRIEVLPYLKQQSLYQQYHMDELWDSENNKKLIDKMPAVFRDPHDDPNSTTSSYSMITGKGTVGDGDRGTKLLDIKDGTSNTIMLVDAKRDIPWTKPEDIEIDPDTAKPLPKLGGHMTDGNFAAAFADGHVEILKDSLSPKILRAFFTIAGGEVIDRNEIDKPATQQPVLPKELKSIEEKPKSSPAPSDRSELRETGNDTFTPMTPNSMVEARDKAKQATPTPQTP
jgi:Protein of unknown function (DUF1559)